MYIRLSRTAPTRLLRARLPRARQDWAVAQNIKMLCVIVPWCRPATEELDPHDEADSDEDGGKGEGGTCECGVTCSRLCNHSVGAIIEPGRALAALAPLSLLWLFCCRCEGLSIYSDAIIVEARVSEVAIITIVVTMSFFGT